MKLSTRFPLRPLRRRPHGVLLGLGLLQLGFSVAAQIDLSRRFPEQLRGPKWAWRLAVWSGGLGSAAYWWLGRRAVHWTEADLPDLSGKVAIVTGANSGLGFETARALYQHGAEVIMACRDLEKAQRAATQILRFPGRGSLVPMPLDLSDLASVRAFAEAFKARYARLDLLINNAGIMLPPLGRTAQGFELQFGVNHLGHFALTAQLIERLMHTPQARIVSISSTAHRFGRITFADLNWRIRSYRAMAAYGQSKLANLLFTAELQRRLQAAGSSTLAVAAHPGYAATSPSGSGWDLPQRLFAQPQQRGAWPTLYAATSKQVRGGEYFGPSGLLELRGAPQRVLPSARAEQSKVASQLWTVSEQLTQTPFSVDLPKNGG